MMLAMGTTTPTTTTTTTTIMIVTIISIVTQQLIGQQWSDNNYFVTSTTFNTRSIRYTIPSVHQQDSILHNRRHYQKLGKRRELYLTTYTTIPGLLLSSVLNTTNTISTVNLLRGGAISTSESSTTSIGTKKKKKKKKSKTKHKQEDEIKTDTTILSKNDVESKHIINEKLKQEDSAAQALGDAIRQNAHLLLSSSQHNLEMDDMDTLESLGMAMGSSDYTTSIISLSSNKNNNNNNNNKKNTSSNNSNQQRMAQELTSPTSVIVHYFLKSHGGVHILQCICSLLASISGITSILLQKSTSHYQYQHQLQYILLRRTLLFAFCKHITGLLSAILVSARTISQNNGYISAMQSIQTIIYDPISQYVFYTLCLLVWLPFPSSSPSITTKLMSTSADTTITPSNVYWWQQYSIVPVLLVGPVLLREVISISFVISDVLTLIVATTLSDTDNDSNKNTRTIERLLQLAQGIVDAGMSILVTPNKWRTSSAVQRQTILAKLVSRISLFMEIAVGILLLVDTILLTVRYVFLNTVGTIRIYSLMKSILCTRLYIQFLWIRRTKIHKLVQSIRGGAKEAPLYMLNVILNPTSSMGIDISSFSSSSSPSSSDATVTRASTNNPTKEELLNKSTNNNRRWIDYVFMALDIGDEK